jgi:ABC-2 type transport system permease protein
MNERWGFSKMLRAAWLLAWKDTLVRCQMRVTVIFIVVLPLAMTLLMGVALRSFGRQDVVVTVAIIDEDRGPVAELVQQIIRDKTLFPASSVSDTDGDSSASSSGVSWEFLSDIPLVEARRRVDAGDLDAVIVLPEGLSRRLEVNEQATLDVFIARGKSERRAAVEVGLDRMVQRARQRDPRPLEWEGRETVETPSDSGYNSFAQAVAGNGVMFILLNCMATGGLALVHEKRQNTMDRLLMSPLTHGTIVLGKTLGVVVIGVAQAIVIFGFGLLVGVNLGSVLGIALVTLLFIFVGSALGLTISAIAHREETIQAVCAPIALVMTALGGGMFPLDAAPGWLKQVSLVFPTGWAMDAYHKLMWDGRDWISVLPNVGVLAGFSVLFFILGIRSLRWH